MVTHSTRPPALPSTRALEPRSAPSWRAGDAAAKQPALARLSDLRPRTALACSLRSCGAAPAAPRAAPRSPAAPLWGRTRRKAPQRPLTVSAAGWGGVAFCVPALAVVACTTLAFLAAAFVSLLLLLRPLLKKLEALAQAAELAARSLEKASAEFELASNVINSELPTTLESVERASVEFEVLGQSLNGLTGGLTGNRRKQPSPGRAKSPPKGPGGGKGGGGGGEAKASGEWGNPVEALTEGTANSMRKVAQDVAALTTALTPAMVAWRKRISFITERFEAASKEGDAPKQLPAGASSNGADGGKQLQESAEAQREVQAWVGEWRQRQQEAEAKPGRSGNGAAAHNVVVGAESLTHAVEGAAAVAASLLDSSRSDPGSANSGDPEQARALEARRQAAHAVFAALSKAEEAASAAAAASGELETALQAAERQAGGSWWGWSPAAPKQQQQPAQQDGGDKQENDGMAYPSSPYLSARGSSSDGEDGTAGGKQPKQGQGSSKGGSKGASKKAQPAKALASANNTAGT